MASNFFKKAMEYKAGDVQDSVEYDYIKKNGIFKVTLNRLFGVMGDTHVMVHLDFKTPDDQMLTFKELTEYTDKKTGQPVESKGANIIRAMIGMASGKGSAKAQWTAEKGRVFGKETDGYTLPSLLKKDFYVVSQVERSVWDNKAREENVIRRILSADGLSLAEYEEALKQVKNEKISSVSEFKGTALEKEQGKTRKYKYKGCTEEEWNEANGGNTLDNSLPTAVTESDDDALPTIELDDSLPTVDIEDTLPSTTEEANTTTEEANTTTEEPTQVSMEDDGLPELDL